MKYNHTEKIKKDRHWKMPECAQFISDVHNQVIDKVFPIKDDKGDALTPYQIGGYNLLKMRGKYYMIRKHIQIMQIDYPSKSIVRI